ncbi:MAG: hemerythrin domain-containing protein [Cyclobacteriaceae bacterium]|nr:hemerythrin domain-containing protein [Cyclobacteriaceae bacterium]
MTQVPPSPHEELKQVLIRYQVSRMHELLYSFEELTRLGVDADFVFALLEVFQEPKAFDRKAFDRFRLETIVDYIRKTHDYYLHRKLLEIEQSIHLLLRAYPEAHPLLVILNDFYTSYKLHLSSHIEVEEKQLLPYILHLQKVDDGKASFQAYPESYSLGRFLVHHHDTETQLEELRLVMQRYSPPPTNETPYRILLSQLEVLEKDLAVHSLIEEEVLLPRAFAMERKWGR